MPGFKTVAWDNYWICNKPSAEALWKELDRRQQIQEKEIKRDWKFWTPSMIRRQEKINIVKQEIKKLL